MSLTNFFKNYSLAKSEQFGEGLVNLAASMDAAGVSEAAVKQKQEEHAETVKQLVEAQSSFKKEKKEFDDLNELYIKKMAAATRAADANDEKVALELLESVEKLAPKLAKEKADYESAERWLTEVQQASDDIAKELLSLREQINEVNQMTKEAQLDAARAKKAQAQAEKLAGLRKASNKFDVAMAALKNQAEKADAEAQQAKIIAEQLRKPAETVSTEAAKYFEVEPTTTETLAEKMARLKAVAN